MGVYEMYDDDEKKDVELPEEVEEVLVEEETVGAEPKEFREVLVGAVALVVIILLYLMFCDEMKDLRHLI